MEWEIIFTVIQRENFYQMTYSVFSDFKKKFQLNQSIYLFVIVFSLNHNPYYKKMFSAIIHELF